MVSGRSILKFFLALEQAEGQGARVRRSIGTSSMKNFPPFLMLDHFNVRPESGGFPEHPHSGQETITYITQGALAHEDFTGSVGILNAGDLQFMTAGKAVVHSEMPVPQKDGSSSVGLQLWVDLPAELKECEPRYRDLKSHEIPIARPSDKVEVKVISGESYGVKSVTDLAYTPVVYYHYTVQPGGEFKQNIPADYNAFLYLMNGSLILNDSTKIPQYNAVFFNRDGDFIQGKIPESSNEQASFILVAAKVFNQPIVQYGPFVQLSKEKIQQKMMSYQYGINGFERMKTWKTLISNGVDDNIVKKINEINSKNAKEERVKKDEL
ncbi:hypothetical protein PACTADRAFT_38834 [Pachysolen tannophilus NRRL Y-2460]|uniref:Pirin N-terminal domain-containing protein n=1 Tax=Pachysolen tannophilus NRRL Y-2460 TaxID=669874 RepID=A0A1E4TZ50_PACTA|nr:hypothetical protein PACTADRAFT_38834 [Pachysolen tannophilus NRRL Y-2460]